MFGRAKKPDVVAFVDYEHWFYGYSNRFQMKPNVDEWLDELKEEYVVKDVFVFGDFSEPNLESDMKRLKKITKSIIHTASEKDGVDKDFTDVIILDQIYRYAAKKKSPKVFVIFTGDAHFLKVAEYLKELGKKVIIYGVRHAFSNKLKSVANSYVEMPRQSQQKDYYNDLIFNSLDHLEKKSKKSKATYWKTVENVAKYNKMPKDRIKRALDNLIRQKYIQEQRELGKGGKKIKVIKVDWERVKRDGMWND